MSRSKPRERPTPRHVDFVEARTSSIIIGIYHTSRFLVHHHAVLIGPIKISNTCRIVCCEGTTKVESNSLITDKNPFILAFSLKNLLIVASFEN